jgi:hypothetical protein
MKKAKKKAERRDLPFDEFVKWPPEFAVLTDQPLTPEQTEAAFEADTFDFRYKLGPLYDILRSADTKTNRRAEKRNLNPSKPETISSRMRIRQDCTFPKCSRSRSSCPQKRSR